MYQLKVNQQQSIIALHQQGWSARRIARELGLDRGTVGKYLAANSKPATNPQTGSGESSPSKPAINPQTGSAWGWNFFGQLNMPSGLSNVVRIAAGAVNSLALKDDGSVVGWGQ